MKIRIRFPYVPKAKISMTIRRPISLTLCSLLVTGLFFYTMLFDQRLKTFQNIQLRVREAYTPASPTLGAGLSDLEELTISVTKYIIFDASNHNGSLVFLDDSERDWLVVVINYDNDMKKGNLLSCQRCFFFSHEMAHAYLNIQKVSNVTLAPYLTSKMAVYRYVFSKGATWVYTTDRPLTVPHHALDRAINEKTTTGLVYNGTLLPNVYEPCHHAVDPFLWPGSGHQGNQGNFLLRPVSSASVYYVVDECIKANMAPSKWNSHIDTRGPLTYVGPSTYAALDFNNVLVSRHTAWTLIASLSSRLAAGNSVSRIKIKFNLIVQRILWETETQIGFIPSQQSMRSGCSSCLIESIFRQIGNDFRTNTANWRCKHSSSIPNCLIALSLDIMEEYFIDESIPIIFDRWAEWIKGGWIPMARRSPLTKKKLYDFKMTGEIIYHTPAKSLREATMSSDMGMRSPFHSKCGSKTRPYKTLIPDAYIFNAILLIVIIHGPQQEELVPILENQYGRFFQNIVYCSTDASGLRKRYATKHGLNPVTILQMNPLIPQPYACARAGIKMNYDVMGYLLVNHKVLLNFWNIRSLPNDQMWFQGFSNIAKLTNAVISKRHNHGSVKKYWIVLKKISPLSELYYTRKEWHSLDISFQRLKTMKMDPEIGKAVSNWLGGLKNYTNCDACALTGKIDLFYLPSYLASNFVFIMDMFSRFSPLNVTIPTTMAGLADDRGIRVLPGQIASPVPSVGMYNEVYKMEDFYIKIGDNVTMNDELYAQFYCYDYLRRLDYELKDFGMNT